MFKFPIRNLYQALASGENVSCNQAGNEEWCHETSLCMVQEGYGHRPFGL